ncbi:MAG: thiamine phosphate synthase [Candidatus Eremiobacteraeota bacterium]|nr:thiamine phosphate synthase [Candidatus Eremiobacteraeota bacterium]
MTFSGIYAIVDDGFSNPLRILDAALAAGILLLQYRAKAGVDRDLLRAMLDRTRAAGAKLVVNDEFEAALVADGWHAGQEDLAGHDLREARARLGSRLFGISAATPQEARVAEAGGADYVGTGPFAATASKDDAGAAIGVEGIAQVVAATRLPVVAIGGIDLNNLEQAASSGAAMVAVISASGRAAAPEAAARALVEHWRRLRP